KTQHQYAHEPGQLVSACTGYFRLHEHGYARLINLDVAIALLRALLVVAILLPELLAQLRIGFLHRRFTQLTRDDVVVAAVRNVRRHGRWPVAATRAAADTATTAGATAARRAAFFTLSLTFALTLLSCAAARLATTCGSVTG